MFCTKNKVRHSRLLPLSKLLYYLLQNPPHDMTMQKRDFLLMLKRLQIVDPLHLTASRIISILAEDDTNVRAADPNHHHGAVRLDIEVGFVLLRFLVHAETAKMILQFRCVFSNSSKH